MDKECLQCKISFEITQDDQIFYDKMGVPAPEYCPDCRQQHRIAFRNFKTLYKTNSAKSTKPMVSIYSPEAPFPVWTIEEWWADDWDAKNFGRDYDFDRPFFDQLTDLMRVAPRYNIMNTQSTNCEYSNQTWYSRDCYMIFGCVTNERCDYGHIVWNSNDCVDNLYVFKGELNYECIDCLGSNKLLYSQECESCADSIGLYDCRACTNCIGCVGLKQKSYHIFNEPVTKEEYEQWLRDHPLTDPATIQLILEKREELRRQVPQRAFFGYQNDDVSGNHIYNSHNVKHSFDIKKGEDGRYGYTVRTFNDSHDISYTADIAHSYNSLTCGGSYNVFSHNTVECTYSAYSENCYNCNNIFGCQSLRKSDYCILNKQYTKEEYESLRPKIIEHMKSTGQWGEWFPKSMTPFGYNESIVNEEYPLTKQQAIELGYRWKDDIPSTTGKETIAHDQLPTDPEQYNDELMKQVLKCDSCSKNYRFISREIAFYKRLGLPLPRQCFNCRHMRRMQSRLPRKLWPGTCANCNQQIQMSYTPEQQQLYKIYCETCYVQEMG